jgi:hypothetical protein
MLAGRMRYCLHTGTPPHPALFLRRQLSVRVRWVRRGDGVSVPVDHHVGSSYFMWMIVPNPDTGFNYRKQNHYGKPQVK